MNWETQIEEGTVFRISGIVRVQEAESYEILHIEDDGADVDALRKERESLLARIAEIDRILGAA